MRPLDHDMLTRTSRSEPATSERSLTDPSTRNGIYCHKDWGHTHRVSFLYIPLWENHVYRHMDTGYNPGNTKTWNDILDTTPMILAATHDSYSGIKVLPKKLFQLHTSLPQKGGWYISIDADRTLKPSQSSVWRIQGEFPIRQDKDYKHHMSCQMEGKTMVDQTGRKIHRPSCQEIKEEF